MSTTAAMASISASNAAISSAAAHRAKVSECHVVIGAYDSHGATVQEMQQYADCIDTVYPKEFTGEETAILKALFVSAIVGAVVIGWRESRKRYSDFSYCFFMSLVGFILTPTAIFCGLLFLCGLKWLFNGV